MPIKSSTRLYDNIESELLREQLVGTSAESPAEAFVKRLFNPSTASQSKFEELLGEQLAASESRAAEEFATSKTRAATAEERLESFKESAELAALTSQNKQSALNHDAPAKEAASQSEIEPPGEQLAASVATVAALRASSPSSFARYAAKAVQQQHRRLDWWCGYSPYLGDGCGQVPVRSVGRCSDSCVEFFGHCYNPATTTCLRVPPRPRRPTRRATAPRRRRDLRDDGLYGRIPTEIGLLTALQTLRIPPASPDARRGARPPLGVAGTSATGSPARSRPRSACSPR